MNKTLKVGQLIDLLNKFDKNLDIYVGVDVWEETCGQFYLTDNSIRQYNDYVTIWNT